MSNIVHRVIDKSGGGVIPPASCSQLIFADAASSNVTLNINNNNVIATSTTVGQGQAILSATNVFRNLETNELVAEVTINAQSSVGAVAGLAFGQLGPNFGGFILMPGSGAAADGQFFDLTFAPVGPPVQITLPHTIQLRVNGNTGQFSFDDGVNSGNTELIPGINVVDSTIYGVASPASGIGETIEFTANGGFTPLAITQPAGSKLWCELTDAGAGIYELIEFFSSGNAVLNNSNRTMEWTTSAGTSSGMTAVASYPIGNTYTYTNETFELEVNQIDVDSIFGKTKIGMLGGPGLGQIQTTLEFDIIGFGSTDAAFEIIVDTSLDTENAKTTPLISRHTMASTDTIISHFNGAETRLGYKVGGAKAETVIFDPIPRPPGAVTTFTTLASASQSGVTASVNTFRATYNSNIADMAVNPYPTGFTDFDGGPLVTAPEVRSAIILKNGYTGTNDSIAQVDVDVTQKVITFTGSPSSPTQMRGNCPLFVRKGTGTIAFGMELTALTTTATIGYQLLAEDLVRADSAIQVVMSAGDLILRTLTTTGGAPTIQTTTIKAAYTFSAGDLIYLEIDTDNQTVRSHLDDGAVTTSASIAYDSADSSCMMPRIANDNVPATETAVQTSQYKAADMAPSIKAALALGTVDLEGVTI
ncbi:hypothetical protein KAR91_82430 [Candidatus Pacearchaeota archaeon]|nr:hypothetical protein [Candidatus Pacearchaeota archaeon]